MPAFLVLTCIYCNQLSARAVVTVIAKLQESILIELALTFILHNAISISIFCAYGRQNVVYSKL